MVIHLSLALDDRFGQSCGAPEQAGSVA